MVLWDNFLPFFSTCRCQVIDSKQRITWCLWTGVEMLNLDIIKKAKHRPKKEQIKTKCLLCWIICRFAQVYFSDCTRKVGRKWLFLK